MAERIDESTEREIEALLDKLIVQKVCGRIETDLESRTEELKTKLTKIEDAEGALKRQIGQAADDGEKKLDDLAAGGQQLKQTLAELSQSGSQLDTKVADLSQKGQQIEDKLAALAGDGQRLAEQLKETANTLGSQERDHSAQLSGALEGLRGLLGEQGALTKALEQTMCRKLDEGEQALEQELKDSAQASGEREKEFRAEMAENREADRVKLEGLFQEQEKKIRDLRWMMFALMAAQVVGLVLAVVQMVR